LTHEDTIQKAGNFPGPPKLVRLVYWLDHDTYFNDKGKEMDVRRGIVEQCSVAKKIQDEEQEKKKAKRLATRMARNRSYRIRINYGEQTCS